MKIIFNFKLMGKVRVYFIVCSRIHYLPSNNNLYNNAEFMLQTLSFNLFISEIDSKVGYFLIYWVKLFFAN